MTSPCSSEQVEVISSSIIAAGASGKNHTIYHLSFFTPTNAAVCEIRNLTVPIQFQVLADQSMAVENTPVCQKWNASASRWTTERMLIISLLEDDQPLVRCASSDVEKFRIGSEQIEARLFRKINLQRRRLKFTFDTTNQNALLTIFLVNLICCIPLWLVSVCGKKLSLTYALSARQRFLQRGSTRIPSMYKLSSAANTMASLLYQLGIWVIRDNVLFSLLLMPSQLEIPRFLAGLHAWLTCLLVVTISSVTIAISNIEYLVLIHLPWLAAAFGVAFVAIYGECLAYLVNLDYRSKSWSRTSSKTVTTTDGSSNTCNGVRCMCTCRAVEKRTVQARKSLKAPRIGWPEYALLHSRCVEYLRPSEHNVCHNYERYVAVAISNDQHILPRYVYIGAIQFQALWRGHLARCHLRALRTSPARDVWRRAGVPGDTGYGRRIRAISLAAMLACCGTSLVLLSLGLWYLVGITSFIGRASILVGITAGLCNSICVILCKYGQGSMTWVGFAFLCLALLVVAPFSVACLSLGTGSVESADAVHAYWRWTHQLEGDLSPTLSAWQQELDCCGIMMPQEYIIKPCTTSNSTGAGENGASCDAGISDAIFLATRPLVAISTLMLMLEMLAVFLVLLSNVTRGCAHFDGAHFVRAYLSPLSLSKSTDVEVEFDIDMHLTRKATDLAATQLQKYARRRLGAARSQRQRALIANDEQSDAQDTSKTAAVFCTSFLLVLSNMVAVSVAAKFDPSRKQVWVSSVQSSLFYVIFLFGPCRTIARHVCVGEWRSSMATAIKQWLSS